MRRPAAEAGAITTIHGSRFLAWLGAAAGRDAAEAALAARAAEHPDATHHCWAWRLWTGERVESAGYDAGEPGGTAGRPIAGALERADVVQAVCVVSRWFGGTKLGTGGLTRAYAEAAAAAIGAGEEAGALQAVAVRARFAVRFGYDRTGAVDAVASRFAARELDAGYGERVERLLAVEADRAGAFAAALAEAGGGAIAVERREDVLLP